jgi:hypothetical protein
MQYWRDDNFKGLADVAAALAADPDLADYAAYLDLREKGLRKPALQRLEQFIDAALNRPVDRRTDFVDRLMRLNHARPEIIDLIPVPLRDGLILPTLDEWARRDPADPAPFRWRGRFRFHDEALPDFRQAIALDPAEQIARTLLIHAVIESVDYSVHELPHGYLGSPQDDLLLLDEALAAARALAPSLEPHPFANRLNGLRETVRAYADYRAGADPQPYADWAAAHNRPARAP